MYSYLVNSSDLIWVNTSSVGVLGPVKGAVQRVSVMRAFMGWLPCLNTWRKWPVIAPIHKDAVWDGTGTRNVPQTPFICTQNWKPQAGRTHKHTQGLALGKTHFLLVGGLEIWMKFTLSLKEAMRHPLIRVQENGVKERWRYRTVGGQRVRNMGCKGRQLQDYGIR